MSNENLYIYEQARSVPDNAKKTIQGGKLKGKTDINPMWRIKRLTEIYGPCGIGWYPEITNKWMVTAPNGEISAFVDLNLYVFDEKIGEWSKPIPGTGGNTYCTEKGVVNDDAYKMAYTDALSVAAKMLGVGADVHWEADNTKYSDNTAPAPAPAILCPVCGKPVKDYTYKDRSGNVMTKTARQVIDGTGMCMDCYHRQKEHDNGEN